MKGNAEVMIVVCSEAREKTYVVAAARFPLFFLQGVSVATSEQMGITITAAHASMLTRHEEDVTIHLYATFIDKNQRCTGTVGGTCAHCIVLEKPVTLSRTCSCDISVPNQLSLSPSLTLCRIDYNKLYHCNFSYIAGEF